MSDDLKEFVRQEGAGWLQPGVDVDAFKWSRVARYPTKRFIKLPLHGRPQPDSRADWKGWLEREKAGADDPDYYRQLQRAWLADPSVFSEIIVAELPDGSLDVGDGWHRLAMSIVAGRGSVPVVVGRPIVKKQPKPARTPKRLDREITEFLTEEALHRRGML